MLPQKYIDFRKRIFLYAATFVIIAFISIFFAPMFVVKKYVLNIPINSIYYDVNLKGEDVHVNVCITFISPQYVEKKLFTFLLTVPENATIENYSIKYPYIKTDIPIKLTDNLLSWIGVLPHKNEIVTFTINYNYKSYLNEVLLPIGKSGTFKFKDTFTSVKVDIDSKLNSYESNYQLVARSKNFHTYLSFQDYLSLKSEDFELSW